MIHKRFNNYGKKDKLSLDQLRLIRQDMLLDTPLKNSFTEKTMNTIIIQYIEHLAKEQSEDLGLKSIINTHSTTGL